jgi:hypothetical protein
VEDCEDIARLQVISALKRTIEALKDAFFTLQPIRNWRFTHDETLRFIHAREWGQVTISSTRLIWR